MANQQYVIKVVGEGKQRARGVLAFVLPQALDLIATTSYVVSVSETGDLPPGVLRLRRRDQQYEASYEANPGRNTTDGTPPAWCERAISMSHELGKQVRWVPTP